MNFDMASMIDTRKTEKAVVYIPAVIGLDMQVLKL
jgi:hypothetical protein